MNCDTAREQIGSYVDGELSAADATALRQHLSGCSVCSAELSSTQALVRILGSPSAGSPPPGEIWTAISARLDRRPRPSRLLRVFHRPIALAASLGLIIGASAFVAAWLTPSSQVAQANTIDYRVLLDG